MNPVRKEHPYFSSFSIFVLLLISFSACIRNFKSYPRRNIIWCLIVSVILIPALGVILFPALGVDLNPIVVEILSPKIVVNLSPIVGEY